MFDPVWFNFWKEELQGISWMGIVIAGFLLLFVFEPRGLL